MSELTATPTAGMSGQPGTRGPSEAARHPHAAAWVSPGETTEGQPDCHPETMRIRLSRLKPLPVGVCSTAKANEQILSRNHKRCQEEKAMHSLPNS